MSDRQSREQFFHLVGGPEDGQQDTWFCPEDQPEVSTTEAREHPTDKGYFREVHHRYVRSGRTTESGVQIYEYAGEIEEEGRGDAG